STTRCSSAASTCWRNRLATPALAESEPAAPPMAAAAINRRLTGIRKTYGDVVAVDRVDLEIPAGEFFTLLGPSGSGKTTTLRLIAGFERPDEGRVELAGADVTNRAPYERDVNTVFQDYALFPHMTVAENVAYGLRVKHVPRAERRRRVDEILKVVRLPELGAGFVGVSNVLERDGRKFTVRPEKIRMHFDEARDGEPGRIRDVVYVGMFTRYVVELDSGGELTVVRQNLETSSQDVLESR